jgi:multidrug resistance efflux pump
MQINLLRTTMSAIDSVRKLALFAQSVQADLATTKQQLADALANDAADAEAIAAAQADADAAKAKATELQVLADADATEDSEIESLVASVLPAEPDPVDPVVDPAPVEPTPEADPVI